MAFRYRQVIFRINSPKDYTQEHVFLGIVYRSLKVKNMLWFRQYPRGQDAPKCKSHELFRLQGHESVHLRTTASKLFHYNAFYNSDFFILHVYERDRRHSLRPKPKTDRKQYETHSPALTFHIDQVQSLNPIAGSRFALSCIVASLRFGMGALNHTPSGTTVKAPEFLDSGRSRKARKHIDTVYINITKYRRQGGA